MKVQTTLRFLILFFIALIVYLVVTQIHPGAGSQTLTEFEPDGIDMEYTAFDRENRRTVVIRAQESRNAGDDRTQMKDIRATIFKKGRLDQDLTISSDEGYVTNDFNRFYLEKNARIRSRDLDLQSENFLIKGRNRLVTDKAVSYTTGSLRGTADRGMEYFIKLNVITLFDTQGTYERDGRTFAFSTSRLWIMDREKTVVLETGSEFKEGTSLLKSNRLELIFDDEFEQLKRAISHKDSYLYMEDETGETVREAKSGHLENVYNTQGQLMRTITSRDAQVFFHRKARKTEIFSPEIVTDYRPESGQIERVRMDSSGKIDHQGDDDFTLSADRSDILFEDGAVRSGRAAGNCVFRFDTYTGTSQRLRFDLKKDTLHLIGPDATIRRKQNTFVAGDYTVDLKKNILQSDREIRSIVTLEQKNVLFSEDNLFIHARHIKIFTEENKVSYTDRVRLYQGDTILRSESLEFSDPGNILAKGQVFLSFRNNEDVVVLQGKTVTFDSEKRTIHLTGRASVQNGNRTLGADDILIRFNDRQELETILGEKSAQFNKDDISGKSEKVRWDFIKDEMTFREAAEIRSKTGGVTKGQELKLDLKTEKITILSGETDRTKTVIDEG